MKSTFCRPTCADGNSSPPCRRLHRRKRPSAVERCLKSSRCSAFTILELLIVVMLLAIIAAIMFPALAGTQPNSKNLQCLNNHRQIAAAVSMYTQDNHDLYPPNPDDGTIKPGYVWCAGNVETSRTA